MEESVEEVIMEEPPEVIMGVYETVLAILTSYGWTILFALVVLNLLWSHFHPKWRKWRERIEDQRQSQEYQQNPELLIAREEGLRRARQRLQEEHDRLAQEHAEKVKRIEEEKRQEKIRLWEQLQSGRTLKKKETDDKPKPLRGEFNPLMGSSGGSCYRPSRRSGASGGG